MEEEGNIHGEMEREKDKRGEGSQERGRKFCH